MGVFSRFCWLSLHCWQFTGAMALATWMKYQHTSAWSFLNSKLRNVAPQRQIRSWAKHIRKHSLGTFPQAVGNCLRISVASDQTLQTKGFQAVADDLGKFTTECATARCTFPFVFAQWLHSCISTWLQLFGEKPHELAVHNLGIFQSLCFVLWVLRQVYSISLGRGTGPPEIGKLSYDALKLQK